MTQEEIIDYNKRCAELLNWEIVENEILTVPDDCKVKPQIYFPAYQNLLFHSDWNWIMEVVEAIEKLDISVLIGKNSCVIEQYFGKTPFELPTLKAESKKEAVVQAINQFLIWYNDRKRKTNNS